MAWAKEVGLEKTYNADEIPWCGLFVCILAHRADKPVAFAAKDALWARNWTKFGSSVQVAMVGDVLVFVREGGGHVGLYVGEDTTHYHVLGGNQGNQVSIVRIEKKRCIGIRRPHYNSQPPSVKRVHLNASGVVSRNEA
jgi:uncharacterized protein (TIGR02594 family)